MKLDLTIEDFESISEAVNKKGLKAEGSVRISTQSIRTLLVDHSRALNKLVELGEKIGEEYAYHSEVRKAK